MQHQCFQLEQFIISASASGFFTALLTTAKNKEKDDDKTLKTEHC